MENFVKPVIAIVGAGPAGLTAGVILQRGGHHFRIFESGSFDTGRAQGGTLDLHQDKGQVALERAGLLASFRAIARHEDQVQRNIDPFSGKEIVDAGRPDDDIDRPEIDRGALRKLLLDALPRETVRWDCRLVAIEAGIKHRHTLLFADGTCFEADVVIGADGAWSCVRPFLSSVIPKYTGITFFEGWIDQPTSEAAGLVGKGSLFAFGGAQAIFAQRNGQGRLCVYAALKRSRNWLADQLSARSAASLIKATYRDWSPNLRNLLDACRDFTARPIHALPADFAWLPHTGVTLIGDAAHLMPPVGLGVNLAMLDAADVANALNQEGDWSSALRKTEILISARASSFMRGATEGFKQWFEDTAVTADGA